MQIVLIQPHLQSQIIHHSLYQVVVLLLYSTLTTVGDICLSQAGQYQCTAALITAGISDSNTTDFDVKCKLY